MSVISTILALMVLKSAPQDIPYSSRLAVQLALAYIVSGIVVLQTTINPDSIIISVLSGFFIQYVFIWFLLRALNKGARFVQTFSAILGVSLLFNLLSWPIFAILTVESETATLQASMSLAFLMIISWEILVKAHIFRHALDMKMFSALMLSFSLFFISVALSQLFFPVEGAA